MKSYFGLIGGKLGHSISPKIHKYIFDYYNIDGIYNLYELNNTELGQFIYECKNKELKGLNITIPYKLDIMKFIDHISKEAESIGAVNTILFKDDKLYGFNTDYYGIAHTFKRHNISIENRKAVVLGSGGAATAVFQYLKDNNCKDISFIVRNSDAVKRSLRFNGSIITGYDGLSTMGKGDILINCTPVGMYPAEDRCPVPETFIKQFNFVFDLIYNPLKTKLLCYAESYGITCSNGLYMLVAQAVSAAAIWNNTSVDEHLIEDIYNKLCSEGLKK